MSFIKSMLVFVIASLALAGVASASSIYNNSASSNHSISQQMVNVISKNAEALNH